MQKIFLNAFFRMEIFFYYISVGISAYASNI